METENERKKKNGELTGIFRKQATALWNLPEAAGQSQFKTGLAYWYHFRSSEVFRCLAPTGGGQQIAACALLNTPLWSVQTPSWWQQQKYLNGVQMLRSSVRPSLPAFPTTEHQRLNTQRLYQQVWAFRNDESVSPKLGDCQWRFCFFFF